MCISFVHTILNKSKINKYYGYFLNTCKYFIKKYWLKKHPKLFFFCCASGPMTEVWVKPRGNWGWRLDLTLSDWCSRHCLLHSNEQVNWEQWLTSNKPPVSMVMVSWNLFEIKMAWTHVLKTTRKRNCGLGVHVYLHFLFQLDSRDVSISHSFSQPLMMTFCRSARRWRRIFFCFLSLVFYSFLRDEASWLACDAQQKLGSSKSIQS